MTQRVDKDSLPLNQPRRTPSHPTKSHIVKTKVDGKEKIIRFGEQGASTAGKPKAGESDRMTAKRDSFKARHAANIAKGPASAAYWANKVKWADGGVVHMKEGGYREQDTVSALKPKYPTLEAIARGLQGGADQMSKPVTYQFGKRSTEAIPPTAFLSELLSIPALARTAERLAYGESLTSGRGQTLRPLNDTTDVFLTVAPSVGPLARIAGKTVKAGIKNLQVPTDPLFTGPLGKQRGVIKLKGGNWLDGRSERITEPLKRQSTLPDLTGTGPVPLDAPDIAVNNWIDKKLNPYVRNEMGTPEDPLRLMAEQYAIDKPELLAQADAKLAKLNAKTQELMQERGVPAEYLTRHRQDIIAAEKARDLIEARQALHTQVPEGGRWEPENLAEKRVGAGFPAKGLGVSEEAKNWEQVSDEAINMLPAGERIDRGFVSEVMGLNTWLNKVPPETPTYTGYGTNELNFGHLSDELRNALNPESGLPADLLLDYADLSKKTVPDIVSRVADINAWRATQKAEADLARANNAAAVVVKEYPQQGLAWKEIKLPQPVLKEGYLVTQEPDINGLFKVVDPSGKAVSVGATKNEALNLLDREERYKALEDALKYEGDILQHCVGGYCPDVAQGKSLIYSLRDTQGKSHATVEVKPKRHPIGTTAKGNNFPYEITYGKYADPPVKIPEETKQKIYDLGKQLHEQNGGSPSDNFDIAANQILGPLSQEITQIKGLRNQAPAEKYQAQLQDFIKSGNWSDVADLENAGLYKLDKDFLGDATKRIPTGETSGMFLSEEREELILKAMEAKLLPERGYITKEEYENALKAVAPDEGMARGGPVSLDELAAHYEEGGGVKASTVDQLKTMLGKFTSLNTPEMTFGETAADIAAGFVPGVGTAMSARDFERARRDDDYLGMALSGVGLIPVVGGMARGANKMRQADKGLEELYQAYTVTDRANAGRKAAELIKSQEQVKASEALGQLMEKGFKKTTTTQADRTRVGGGNIGGAPFSAISEVDPAYAGKVWGVMDQNTASRLTNLTTPETAWTTMLGSATQLKTNPIVFDKLKRGFVDSMKQGNLSDELAGKINHNLALTFGKGADIRDPKIWKEADTFDKRAALADAMMGQGIAPSKGGVALGGEKSGKGVIFRPTDILKRETEPYLLHSEHGGDIPTYAAGPRMFSLDKTSEYRPDLHPGFPTLIGGKDLNFNVIPTPTEIYLPDWHREFKAANPDRKGPQYYDLALGMKDKGLPSQDLNDAYIRHLMREGFAEGGSVGNSAAEYDPLKIDAIMASIDAPRNYAEGGSVMAYDPSRIDEIVNQFT